MTGQSGDVTVRRYVRRLFGLAAAANYFGIAIVTWYGFFALRVWPEDRSSGRIISELLVALVPIVAISTMHAFYLIAKQGGRAMRWMIEERSPTASERQALCSLPTRLANNGAMYWVLGGLALFPYLFFALDFRPGIDGVLRIVISYVLIAIIPWSLTFLLVELGLRPLFAQAFTDDAELPKTLGIPARLMLAWVATSGLPFLGVFMLLVGQTAERRELAIPGLFTIFGASTVAGIAIAIFSGRYIIDPIAKVRNALRAVERGDLDIQIPVSESAELGELQTGVNRMVLGLRERERMREIFGRHVGAEVAARALASDSGLGGERHEATAMFVDVIGSSFMVDRKDPDDVVVILNDFFDAVVRVVSAEGGIVNKFEGDGALCIFGVPVEQSDHAERALRAGERLQQELSELTGDIGAAIGISSGTVVAGNIGAADRYEYTVIGSPVHEASRLCDEAKLTSARILASESAIRSAGAHDTGWVAADTVLLRGRSEMTATYTPPEAEPLS
jgi:adenylate cyclase